MSSTALATRRVTSPALLLEELAAVAVQEHNEVERGLTSVLEHAIRAGEALLEAQSRFTAKQLKKGEWTQYLIDNDFHAGVWTARRYMRLANYAAELPSRDMTIQGATQALEGLPPISGNTRSIAYDEDLHEEAARLRSQGFSYERIAAEIGVSAPTVNHWLNPATKKNQRKRARAAVLALRQKERDAAVRQRPKNDPQAIAYASARQAVQKLQAAADRESDPETKSLLHKATLRQEEAIDDIWLAISTKGTP